MSVNGKNLVLTLLVSLFTLGLLLGTYFFYKHFFVNQPLSVTLDNSELVNKYQIIQDRKKPVLKIEFNKVNDLAYEFQQFLIESGQILTEKELELEITSKPNHKILNFYQEVHPSLYEALELGNYSELQEKIKEINETNLLTKADLSITKDYVYLQLEDKEYYLYTIFNRHENSFPKITNIMGSDFE